MPPAYRLISFGLALAASAVVAGLVIRGHASHRLTAAWAAAVLLFALATLFVRRGRSFRLLSVAPLLFAAALPVVVRVVGQPPDRMHADEFLTAYFSATHDFAQSSFFGYMPEKWEWQGQFPKPFFFLQRLFFGLFGESTTSVRLSVQPYVAIVSVMLFLTVRELTDTIGGLVAVVLYSFFAPSVYLESLGFFFISSTAFFSVFFYFGLRELRTGELSAAAMTGVACGFCYLTYPSSYLAFPLLLASFAVHWVRERKLRVIQNFSIALGG